MWCSSAQERLLDLGERRVFVKPLALCSVLVAECALDVDVRDGKELLYNMSVAVIGVVEKSDRQGKVVCRGP
jgi:hypothetical protein